MARRPRRRAVALATAATIGAPVELLATNRTVEQVAAQLGVDPLRIRHRVADKALYGLRVGRRLLLPAW